MRFQRSRLGLVATWLLGILVWGSCAPCGNARKFLDSRRVVLVGRWLQQHGVGLFGRKRTRASLSNTNFAGDLFSSAMDAFLKRQHGQRVGTATTTSPLLATTKQSSHHTFEITRSRPNFQSAILSSKGNNNDNNNDEDDDDSNGQQLLILAVGGLGLSVVVLSGIPWILRQMVGTSKIQFPRFSLPWTASRRLSIQKWGVVCRDQHADFWKSEILPELFFTVSSSSSSSSSAKNDDDDDDDDESGDQRPDLPTNNRDWLELLEKRPDLVNKIKQETKSSMKQRMQLAKQVSQILDRQFKKTKLKQRRSRQPHPRRHIRSSLHWTEIEQALVARYYSEITVEKLHFVIEALERRLERRASQESSINSSEMMVKRRRRRRQLSRNLLVEGLQGRIQNLIRQEQQTYQDGNDDEKTRKHTINTLGKFVEEATLRELFKESLREAIVAVVGVSGDDDDDETPITDEQSATVIEGEDLDNKPIPLEEGTEMSDEKD